MIRIDLFDTVLDDTSRKVMHYVNENLRAIVKTLIDFLEDNNDFNADDFLPQNNLRIDNETWTKMVYDLYEMITSSVPRDYIMPKYEYLLYIILQWWEDCADNEENLLPIELSQELIDELRDEYDDEKYNVVLKSITDYDNYYYMFFQDHDFLPDNLEKMLIIYLRSSKFFKEMFPDVDLDEYYCLMPKDLQELYDKAKGICTKETDTKIMYEELYKNILWCCERIQADHTSRNAIEDELNDKLRNLLDSRYYLRDQTRQGVSSRGKQAGEVDILVKTDNFPISLIEALRLSSVNEKYISEHIDKIYKYDTLGYEYNFIISYVKTSDFYDFYERYRNYIISYNYPYEMTSYDIDNYKQFAEIKTIEVNLNRENIDTKLLHILVHIPN